MTQARGALLPGLFPSAPGGRITVKLWAGEYKAFAEIIDQGRGIPPELAEQVFLPLVSGRADGTGLGLALAQQVAREHRGSLAYRSRPGHTVFTLLLPMQYESHVEQESADG